MYQCSKKLATCKEHCCFDHSDFSAHSMFTSDVCWGSLGTSIFGNSSSAASNTRSRLPSWLSFGFLWLCLRQWSFLMKFLPQTTVSAFLLNPLIKFGFEWCSIKTLFKDFRFLSPWLVIRIKEPAHFIVLCCLATIRNIFLERRIFF